MSDGDPRYTSVSCVDVVLMMWWCSEVDGNSEFWLESDVDEFHHKATRTLFIGNLDKAVTKDMLRDTFNKFGHIVVSSCTGLVGNMSS